LHKHKQEFKKHLDAGKSAFEFEFAGAEINEAKKKSGKDVGSGKRVGNRNTEEVENWFRTDRDM